MTPFRPALVVGTTVLALAIACSDRKTPIAPTPTFGTTGPDGATLKIAAPTPQAPADGAQVQGAPVLVFSNVTGQHTGFPVTYEVELREGQDVVARPTIAASDGATTELTVTQDLAFDRVHTWRVRATHDEAFGPWSAPRTFRTMPAAYIDGAEIFDPLTTGTTVGRVVGSVDFLPAGGVRLNSAESHIRYDLPVTLQEGEFSMLVTGVDEGSPGDKSKIMAMQEGTGDITTNDYRFTAELRGRDYETPGTIRFRIITRDASNDDLIRDSPRIAVEMSDQEWYLWRLTWRLGSARLEVRQGGPDGPTVYDQTVFTAGVPYRPVPHTVYIGSPVGRNGPIDATLSGMIAKHVWVSSRPRPNFPN